MTAHEDPARTFLSSIDRTIHEPARLVIMSHLFVLESADFRFLMTRTGLTEGNLSSHIRKLEDAGYVEVSKGFKGRRPHTMLGLTKEGRSAFKKYYSTMREFFKEEL